MSFLTQPRHILLASICGLVNQGQQQIIEFQNVHGSSRVVQGRQAASGTVTMIVRKAELSFLAFLCDLCAPVFYNL